MFKTSGKPWNRIEAPYARMAADSGVEEIVTEVVVPKGSASVRVGTTFECRRLASDGHRHSPCAKVACCG